MDMITGNQPLADCSAYRYAEPSSKLCMKLVSAIELIDNLLLPISNYRLKAYN